MDISTSIDIIVIGYRPVDLPGGIAYHKYAVYYPKDGSTPSYLGAFPEKDGAGAFLDWLNPFNDGDDFGNIVVKAGPYTLDYAGDDFAKDDSHITTLLTAGENSKAIFDDMVSYAYIARELSYQLVENNSNFTIDMAIKLTAMEHELSTLGQDSPVNAPGSLSFGLNPVILTEEMWNDLKSGQVYGPSLANALNNTNTSPWNAPRKVSSANDPFNIGHQPAGMEVSELDVISDMIMRQSGLDSIPISERGSFNNGFNPDQLGSISIKLNTEASINSGWPNDNNNDNNIANDNENRFAYMRAA